MDAVRTPLVGIVLAFMVLVVETFAGSALMTRTETRSELRQQYEVDELVAELQRRHDEIKILKCPRGLVHHATLDDL